MFASIDRLPPPDQSRGMEDLIIGMSQKRKRFQGILLFAIIERHRLQ
jgi:hypothetical protein